MIFYKVLMPLLLVPLMLIGSTLSGCTKKEAPPPPQTARVSATSAFQTYFGPAPTTDKGTCYAFVIYFPSATQQGKVVPFPFFSFDEQTVKKVALERQISGMDEQAYRGQFLQLFPPGTRLLSLTEQGGRLIANYSKEVAPVATNPGTAVPLFNAVARTLAQFPTVSGVRIQSEGRDLVPPDKQLPGDDVVQQPSSPRLLKVVAMRETAVAPIGEVDAMFDRPVDIREFQFSGEDGTPIAGDVFHSVFDMAAVLKPKDPSKLSAGKRVKVRWNVVDRMGRGGSGEEVVPLDVKVHQD